MNLNSIITESINETIYHRIILEAVEQLIREEGEDVSEPREDGGDAQPDNTNQQNQNNVYVEFGNRLAEQLGNGLDSSAVNNNEQAAQHVANLNQFVETVIHCIKANNILPNNNSNNYDYYNRTRPLSQQFLTGTNGIVNQAAKWGDQLVNITPGIKDIFGGVPSAFAQGHAQVNNQTLDYLRDKEMRDRFGKSGMSLVDLMGLNRGSIQMLGMMCYVNLYHDYTQYGNLLDQVPNLTEIYTTLAELQRTLANNMKMNPGQVGNTGKKGEGGTAKPEDKKKNIYKDLINKIRNAAKKCGAEYNKLAESGKIGKDILDGLKNFENYGSYIVESYENGVYTSERYSYDTTYIPLIWLLSIEDNTHELNTLDNQNDFFNGLVKAHKDNKKEMGYINLMDEVLMAAYNLREALIKDGVFKEAPSSEGGTAKLGETPEENSEEKSVDKRRYAKFINAINKYASVCIKNVIKLENSRNNDGMDEDVARNVEHCYNYIADFAKLINKAVENDMFYTKDTEGTGFIPLTYLLSLYNGKDANEFISFNKVEDYIGNIYKDHYDDKKAEKHFSTIYKLFESIFYLREALGKDDIVDNDPSMTLPAARPADETQTEVEGGGVPKKDEETPTIPYVNPENEKKGESLKVTKDGEIKAPEVEGNGTTVEGNGTPVEGDGTTIEKPKIGDVAPVAKKKGKPSVSKNTYVDKLNIINSKDGGMDKIISDNPNDPYTPIVEKVKNLTDRVKEAIDTKNKKKLRSIMLPTNNKDSFVQIFSEWKKATDNNPTMLKKDAIYNTMKTLLNMYNEMHEENAERMPSRKNSYHYDNRANRNKPGTTMADIRRLNGRR